VVHLLGNKAIHKTESKLAAVFRLTRIEHSAMLVIAVLAAEVIVGKSIPLAKILLSLISPVLISMGAFAINDYFDIEVDKLNKKNRPLVTGVLKPKDALYITAVSMLVGVIASAAINAYCFAIAAIFAVLAVSYSYKLKEMLLLGNAYIAFSMAIPFIFGNYVSVSSLYMSIAVISTMIFISGMAREIHGTIRDYSGDIKIRAARTLPTVAGVKGSAVTALILYLIAIAISIYIFFYIAPFKFNMLYAFIVGLSDLLLLYVAIGYIYKGRKFYDRARNISLAAMALALLAFLFSPLVAY